MRVTVEFEMTNASFEDDQLGELKRVFSSCVDKVVGQLERAPGCICDHEEIDDVILDVNGNRIGTVTVNKQTGWEISVGVALVEGEESHGRWEKVEIQLPGHLDIYQAEELARLKVVDRYRPEVVRHIWIVKAKNKR